MESRVLYASVSHTGSLFTKKYAMHDGAESIYSEWYSVHLFDNLPKGTPVFRFDKTDYTIALKSVAENYFCKEYRNLYLHEPVGNALSLEDFIAHKISIGVVVEYWDGALK